jgi:hypothetical protein
VVHWPPEVIMVTSRVTKGTFLDKCSRICSTVFALFLYIKSYSITNNHRLSHTGATQQHIQTPLTTVHCDKTKTQTTGAIVVGVSCSCAYPSSMTILYP